MLIEEYFSQIDAVIKKSIMAVHIELVKDKRSLYIGFIEGRITFLDGSTLHFVEFVDVRNGINRYKYSYHYQHAEGQMIFRYDMAPHHNELVSFPHHKHLASGEISEAFAMELNTVLDEIEQQLI